MERAMQELCLCGSLAGLTEPDLEVLAALGWTVTKLGTLKGCRLHVLQSILVAARRKKESFQAELADLQEMVNQCDKRSANIHRADASRGSHELLEAHLEDQREKRRRALGSLEEQEVAQVQIPTVRSYPGVALDAPEGYEGLEVDFREEGLRLHGTFPRELRVPVLVCINASGLHSVRLLVLAEALGDGPKSEQRQWITLEEQIRVEPALSMTARPSPSYAADGRILFSCHLENRAAEALQACALQVPLERPEAPPCPLDLHLLAPEVAEMEADLMVPVTVRIRNASLAGSVSFYFVAESTADIAWIGCERSEIISLPPNTSHSATLHAYFAQPGVYNLNRFRLFVVGMPSGSVPASEQERDEFLHKSQGGTAGPTFFVAELLEVLSPPKNGLKVLSPVAVALTGSTLPLPPSASLPPPKSACLHLQRRPKIPASCAVATFVGQCSCCVRGRMDQRTKNLCSI
eukprot:g25979.t1